MIKPIVKCGVLGLGLLGSVGAWAGSTTVTIINKTNSDIYNIKGNNCTGSAQAPILAGKTGTFTITTPDNNNCELDWGTSANPLMISGISFGAGAGVGTSVSRGSISSNSNIGAIVSITPEGGAANPDCKQEGPGSPQPCSTSGTTWNGGTIAVTFSGDLNPWTKKK